MWRIQLLGRSSLFFEDRVCEEITSQESLLLAALALAPKRSLTRSELTETLWGEEDGSEDLAHRLRQTLFKFKTKLRAQFGSDGLLVIQKETVSLNRAAVVDAAEFEAAIRAAKQATDLTIEAEQLTRAIQVYSGQFLPHHPNQFCEERARWSRQYQEAQQRLEAIPSLHNDASPSISASSLPSTDGDPSLSLPSSSPVLPRVRQRRYKFHVTHFVGVALLLFFVRAGTRRTPIPSSSPPPITLENVSSCLYEMKEQQVRGSIVETEDERKRRMKRHAELCVALVEAADARLVGPEEQIWESHLQNTRESQRIALEWCLTNDPEKALQLSGALAPYWFRQAISDNNGQHMRILAEGRHWIEAALERSKASHSLARARALRRYILLGLEVESLTRSRSLMRYGEEALALCREAPRAGEIAETRRLLALATAACGLQQDALKQYKAVLETYRSLQDEVGEAQTFLNMAHLGALSLPRPAQNAAWGRESLIRFRKVESAYGIQRALSVYENSVKGIEPRFAEERRHWDRQLLEDYQLEVQRSEGLPDFASPSPYRRKLLLLASTLGDKEAVITELFWRYRYWNRFRQNLSREAWAKMEGVILTLDRNASSPFLLKTERREIEERTQSYLSTPRLFAEFQIGRKMSLKEAVAFVANQS